MESTKRHMYPEKPNNTQQKVAASLVALVVITLLAGGAMLSANSKSSVSDQGAVATTSSAAPSTSLSTAPAASNSSSATASQSGYKDGTYSASIDYYVPHGSESIKVTLTISGGTVTNSTIENSEYDRESARFQEDFAAEYKSYVVGKPISNLQLDYVAGASDTTQGFNDAVQKIQSEARA